MVKIIIVYNNIGTLNVIFTNTLSKTASK